MTATDEISVEDLRKALLNIADATRLTSEALDQFATNLSRTLGTPQFVPMLKQSLRAANGRLVNAVDLLVKTDDRNSS